ncbi:MAG: response regulator [Myxococcota bacterium]|nr:response regulator [Myxococcota bacterium]
MHTPDIALESKGIILVVDPEAGSREHLCGMLRHHGYEVREAEDEATTLNALNDEPIDVVVLDLMTADGNGIEICERLRDNITFGRVPVVFVTANDEKSQRIRGKEAGADDFLTKPVDDLELAARIKNLVLVRRYYQHIENDRISLMRTVEEQTGLLSKAMIEIGRAKQTLRRFNEEIIVRLSKAVEFRDDETGNHVQRMSRYCGLIAAHMGMSPEMAEAVRIASALHDVGKISIPDEILRKPGRLTPEEMVVMRRHAEKGYRVLTGSESSLLELAATIARSHHERYDGTGYPQRLVGKDIPFEGRIASVADVFDALTSARVYKRAFSIPKAMEILEKERGSGFDPQIVDVFLNRTEEIKNIMIVYADR